MKRTQTRQDMVDYLNDLILDENGSEKIEMDNLDWARLVNYHGQTMVENEYGTVYDLEDLSDAELEIFWMNN